VAALEDNRELVARTLAGDTSAFGELVTRYREGVSRLCYHYLASPEEAQDATQETFVNAYLRLPQLRDADRFAPWLRRIAANLCTELLRRRSRKEVSLGDADTEKAPQASLARDADLGRLTARTVVQEAFGRLPEKSRLTAKLFYIAGYSRQEIADFLQIPEGTVRSRLHHAKQQLRKEMIRMMSVDRGEAPSEERLKEIPQTLPVLALRDQVFFPFMKMALCVGRQGSVKALEEALGARGHILCVAQRNSEIDNPRKEDLYRVGTVTQCLRHRSAPGPPEGMVWGIFEGLARARIMRFAQAEPYCRARVSIVREVAEATTLEAEALIRNVVVQFERFLKVSPELAKCGTLSREKRDASQGEAFEVLPREALEAHLVQVARKMESPGLLADDVTSKLERTQIARQQQILETADPGARLRLAAELLAREVEILETEACGSADE